MSERRIIALTGASGVEYALRFLWQLSQVSGESDIIVSNNFYTVLDEESRIAVPTREDRVNPTSLLEKAESRFGSIGSAHRFVFFENTDIAARAASGSAVYKAMVVLPCSMKTLASIAAGLSQNLIERAADVCIKERRPLVLCMRETPLSAIHLRNMLSLSEMGVTILPLMPGYYHRPQSLEALYDFMVDRIFQHIGIPKRTTTPWRENLG